MRKIIAEFTYSELVNFHVVKLFRGRADHSLSPDDQHHGHAGDVVVQTLIELLRESEGQDFDMLGVMIRLFEHLVREGEWGTLSDIWDWMSRNAGVPGEGWTRPDGVEFFGKYAVEECDRFWQERVETGGER